MPSPYQRLLIISSAEKLSSHNDGGECCSFRRRFKNACLGRFKRERLLLLEGGSAIQFTMILRPTLCRGPALDKYRHLLLQTRCLSVKELSWCAPNESPNRRRPQIKRSAVASSKESIVSSKPRSCPNIYVGVLKPLAR